MKNLSSLSKNSKKRVLIVNCYFDDMRLPVGRKSKVPQAMGPVYLAGAFSPRNCEVRLYNEMFSGPLEDERLLSWPDMLVLTGLSITFDRMLHLTAYARTKNNRVLVVAGGSAIRALPVLSRRYFDYACLGDIEEMQDVIEDAFGREHVAFDMHPRYDLAYWMWAGRFRYVESSRYCNFRCSFCSLTGENRSYRKYDIEFVRRQILSIGKGKHVLVFLDNNFYGHDRQYFLDRIELLNEMREAGYFKYWVAPITNDFFQNDENIKLAKKSGCISLFTGLESFDLKWLKEVNKMQNTRIPQTDMIIKCINHGIVLIYGIMFDVTKRRITDLRQELELILDRPEIPLPSFFSIATPILGTPFFKDCLENDLILPMTKMRDLDTTTLTLRPIDDFNAAVKFVYDIQTLRGYKGKVLRHSLGYLKKYRSTLSFEEMLLSLVNAAILTMQIYPDKSMNLNSIRPRNRKRTHVSTTEPLDEVYRPAFRVDSRFESYFRPTMVTDEEGNLSKEIEEDVFEEHTIGPDGDYETWEPIEEPIRIPALF